MENSQKLGALFDKDTYAVPQKVTLLGILELKGGKLSKIGRPIQQKAAILCREKLHLYSF